jgi:DNA-binding MarR family transcriptional regulator
MDFKDIIILKIFELIEKNHEQSQRSISKRLNISLGNVNAILKGLVETGFIRFEESSKNRVQYIMTEKGDSEKNRLVYEYLQFSLNLCKHVKGRIQKALDALSEQNARYIVLFGAGDLAEMIFPLLKKAPFELVGIIDQNLSGQVFVDRTVMPPSQLENLTYDKIIVTELTDDITLDNVTAEFNIPKDKWVVIK